MPTLLFRNADNGAFSYGFLNLHDLYKHNKARNFGRLYYNMCKSMHESCHQCEQESKHYDEHDSHEASRLSRRCAERSSAATGASAVIAAKSLPCYHLRRHSLTQFVEHFTPLIGEAERVVKAARTAVSKMKSHCSHFKFNPICPCRHDDRPRAGLLGHYSDSICNGASRRRTALSSVPPFFPRQLKMSSLSRGRT